MGDDECIFGGGAVATAVPTHSVSGFTTGPMPFTPIHSGMFPKVSTAGTTHEVIHRWNTKALHSLFGLAEWEESQLYSLLDDLGLLACDTFCISGGAIVRHLMNTDIYKGDLDVYPCSKEAAENLIRHYEKEGKEITKSKYSSSFEHKVGVRKIKVQIIREKAAQLSTVLSEFDFEHVRIAYTCGEFASTMGATTAIAQRKLHLRYITEPNYSLLRALKYKRMGFDADKAITQLAVMINRGEKDLNAAEWEEKNPIVEY